MSCYCDYEMPEFFSEPMRTARKPHVCSECYGEIKVGEKYKYISGLWAGDFQTFKHCEQCLSLVDLMNAHIKCWCWHYGGIITSAVQEIREWGTEASSMVFPVYRHAIRRKHNILARLSQPTSKQRTIRSK